MSETVGALLGIHALTSLHPGSGTALGTVDLPVQRERHTQWPMIAGSALKGVLRDACREKVKHSYQPRCNEKSKVERTSRQVANEEDANLTAVFGPATADADKYAGAISVTDARLLAFPVRSLKGVFAWVTCPAVLERLQRDAALAGLPIDWTIPDLPNVGASSPAFVCSRELTFGGGQMVLEEFDFAAQEKPELGKAAAWVTERLLRCKEASLAPTCRRFQTHFAMLRDDDFTHFARHATEVTARIGLDYDRKTVKSGALFYQEFLPSETLFYALVLAHPARKSGSALREGKDLLSWVRNTLPTHLQIGGDETTGKGLCAIQL